LFNEREQSVCSPRHYFRRVEAPFVGGDARPQGPPDGRAENSMTNREMHLSSEAPELGWAAGPEFSELEAVLLTITVLGVALRGLS